VPRAEATGSLYVRALLCGRRLPTRSVLAKFSFLRSVEFLYVCGAVSINLWEVAPEFLGEVAINYLKYDELGGQANVDGGSSLGMLPADWKKSCPRMSSRDGRRAGSLCNILVMRLLAVSLTTTCSGKLYAFIRILR